MVDFISSTAFTSLCSFWLAMICWSLDWDMVGGAFASSVIVFGALAIAGGLYASARWVVHHVRIVIV